MTCKLQKIKSVSGYVTLSDVEADRLRKHMMDLGDIEAEKHFRISKFTIARAAIGCAIQYGSAVAIRAGLAAL